MSNKFVIVDPSLKDERGHHYALTKTIVEAAVGSGLDVVVFANKNISHLSKMLGVKVLPVFSLSMYDAFIKVKSQPVINMNQPPSKISGWVVDKAPEFIHPFLRYVKNKIKTCFISTKMSVTEEIPSSIKSLSDEILEAIVDEGLGESDVVLVHTADGDTYRAMLELSMRSDFKALPTLHLCTPYDVQVMPHYRKGISVDRVIEYLKLLGMLDERILLYAENPLLAKYLSGEWQVDVHPLEIPPPGLSQTRKNQSDCLHVMYLGAAREEKGFHMLPDVVRHVLSEGELDVPVKFTLQCSPQVIGYVPRIKSAIEKLRQYSNEFVQLIESQQSMNEYYASLQSADVILLCYDHEKYRVRGSGIAVEAVAYGKVIIATPDTFPAALAGGSAGLVASNAKEVAESIITIANNKQLYLDKANIRMNEYLNENSAKRYIDRIIKRCEDVKSRIKVKNSKNTSSGDVERANLGERHKCEPRANYPRLVNGPAYDPLLSND